MARTLTTVAAVLLFAVAALAQTPDSVPSGTIIPVILKTNLNVKKVKVGDEVKLEVTEDVKGADKVVLLPRKAKLTGKVSRVQPRDKDGESVLSFLVEKAEWKNGTATLHAVIAGKVQPPEINSEMMASSNPRSGSSVGGGRSSGVSTGQADSPRAAIQESQSAYTGQAQASKPDVFRIYQGAKTSGVQATEIEGIGLRASAEPGVISELVAAKKNIELESGSTMMLRHMPAAPAAAAKQ